MDFEEYTYYPPKPVINDRNTSSIVKTLVSLLLFIGLFMILPVSINFIFLVVLVLFLHEMGHLIAMKAYGYEDVGMFFIPFLGAVVTGRKEEMSQLQRIIIVLAGPLPGVLIGIFLIFMVQFSDWHPYFIVYGAAFISLNVLNLIPIDPLDGGKLFELLFFSFNDSAKLVFNVLSSLLMVGIGVFFQSYALMFLGIILLSRIKSHINLRKIRTRLNLLDIPIESTYNDLTDKDYWLIRKEYILHSKLDDMMEAESKEYDEKEEVLAPAIRNLLKTPVNNDVSIIGRIFFFLVWVGSIVGSVYAILSILNQLKDFL